MVAALSESLEFQSGGHQQLVFVYGSLKRGYALHYLLEGAKFCSTAVTAPLYRIFDLGEYPGLVDWPEGLNVTGELYEVTEECLQKLDVAEGVAEGQYARRLVQLQAPFDHCNAMAWYWLHEVVGLRDCGTAWP